MVIFKVKWLYILKKEMYFCASNKQKWQYGFEIAYTSIRT